MCIRDRYQRRVRGRTNGGMSRRVLHFVVLLALTTRSASTGLEVASLSDSTLSDDLEGLQTVGQQDESVSRVNDPSCDEPRFRYNGTCVSNCPPTMEPNTARVCACNSENPYVWRSSNVSLPVCMSQCPPGAATRLGNDQDYQCRACNANGMRMSADQSQRKCVRFCPRGQAPNDSNDCAACGPSTPYVNRGTQQCVASCPPGEAPDDDNDCFFCPANQFSDRVSHACVAVCPFGTRANLEYMDCERLATEAQVQQQIDSKQSP
eukprot:TRINITY_DN600_c0_g1_i1.p1 TRINITY_DN600_c0_g1~~TRINITY_DN600_c0_g1_i1.p1  ORF type:complete len:264 (+),score=22.74 TRINITY_DN600_c0_g1_i1:85-876(+)